MKEVDNEALKKIDGGRANESCWKCKCGTKCGGLSSYKSHLKKKCYDADYKKHNSAKVLKKGKSTGTVKVTFKDNGKTMKRKITIKYPGGTSTMTIKFTYAECVYPDSKILVSLNKHTKLAKDLKENDSIAYYDYKEKCIKLGSILKVYKHEKANSFVKYVFEDESFLKVTDYHPIFTKGGWKSSTNRNGYSKPQIGDEVKTSNGWKKITEINKFEDEVDCYDFSIKTNNGDEIDNYFANDILVQNSIVEQKVSIAKEILCEKYN